MFPDIYVSSFLLLNFHWNSTIHHSQIFRPAICCVGLYDRSNSKLNDGKILVYPKLKRDLNTYCRAVFHNTASHWPPRICDSKLSCCAVSLLIVYFYGTLALSFIWILLIIMAWYVIPTVRYCIVNINILIIVLFLNGFVWVCDCAVEWLRTAMCYRCRAHCVPLFTFGFDI